MSSLPALPQRPWLEHVSLGLAIALMLVSTVTLAGWWIPFDELLRPFSDHAPMTTNTAVAFLALGAALVAVERGRRHSAAVAGIAGLIGLLTLAQEVFDRDFGIDLLFGTNHLQFNTANPGRMDLLIAVCLVLGSVALLWRITLRGARARLFTEAIIGSVLASVGLSTLLGYGANLPAVYTWGTQTPTSPIAAIAVVLLGLALLVAAWRESRNSGGEVPVWSPLPAVIGCLTLTIILWIGLRAREQTFTSTSMHAAVDQFAIQVEDVLDRQSSQLERMALRWGYGPENAFASWDSDANTQLTTSSAEVGCVSLAVIDPSLKTVWAFPAYFQENAVGFDHSQVPERRAALEKARASGVPVISTSTPVLIPGNRREKGAIIYTPMFRAGEIAGYVAGEFVYRTMFGNIAAAKAKLDEGYHVAVSIGRETVFTRAGADRTRNDRLAVEKTYNIAQRRMRISITPSDTVLAVNRRYLPELALAAGFGISMLLGLSVHLARSARAGQRAAELSNRKLFAENEERRRVEARLKVSDERLRLALDSTQIGIFEWNVTAGHVYYSPGLWAMLGYEHASMPSTVEAWQSLVHPDDLPLYRRRTESQRDGIASFIEPDYRVRARSGEWRWVYTRSKSVATNPDGRPTRIVGTVQDITARREAELALRESQAEARKLSLVAAKTDNPVLIGSPDGRIEWANEAFCRVMEYSLDEVIGKNPAHFMSGPETNPRTLERIDSAIARGQGISTDVVNYSKSGRKYHLHIEIQPVRGANGELQNFIAVETDITARVQMEHQLRRAKAEADDASRAKSEFLASMSHEIRTPMNGVIGMTSLLMETTLSGEQRDFVNTIRTSGEALLTIINDILDFSKIESGKMELERSPFELAVCLEEALDLFALQASAKNLEIGYHMSSDVPAWVIGDVTRLRQVVVNLVNNAVKFTPSGSISVEVRRVRREPTLSGFEPAVLPHPPRATLEFSVRDTGIGIPEDRRDRLFKAFSQVDSSTTRKYGGTGLGLAISLRLCELMGGGIRLESRPGEGSTFVFTIQTETAPDGSDAGLPAVPELLRDGLVLCVEDHPVTQARLRSLFEKWGVECAVVPDAAAAFEAAAMRQPALLVIDLGDCDGPSPVDALAAISGPRMVLFPFGQTPPTPADDGQPFASISKPIRTAAFYQGIVGLFQAVRPGLATSPRAAGERTIGEEIPLEVLLAEDNAVNQKVALRFLERLGYRADAVANGLEAVTTIENRRYDLVLMDLQMPEMDGFEATRQIRRRLPADRQPKIVALTANAMQADRDQCVSAGMDDYISKPVKMHEIAAAIRRHFGRPAEIPLSQRWIG